MQPVRGATDPRELLLEINIHAAEKNRRARALIFFVEREREVERQHERVVAEPAQRSDEGIVAETAAAIHAARTRSDLHNVHAARRLGEARRRDKWGRSWRRADASKKGCEKAFPFL